MKPVRGVTAQTFKLNSLFLNLFSQCPCTSSGFFGPFTTHTSTDNSRNSATQQSQGDHGDWHMPNKAAQTRLQVACGHQCYKCNQKFPKERKALSKNVIFQAKRIPVKSVSARYYHSFTHSWNGSEKEQSILQTSQCTRVKALTKIHYADLSTCSEDMTTVKSRNVDSDEKSEEQQLDPSLEVMTSSSETCLKTEKVIPGKGPPPEPPVECCMSGCAKCVWIIYAEELKNYYNDGGDAARKAVEKIENPSLKAFLKLELGL